MRTVTTYDDDHILRDSNDKDIVMSDDDTIAGYSTTTIDGELILLFRLAYRVDTVLSSIVLLLLQVKYKMIQHATNDDIAITRLVLFHKDDLISSTTTVRRPLPSTVPSLAPSYSATSTDGELILLFRSAYRVNGMYRMMGTILSSTVFLVNGMYGIMDTILSSTVFLLQSRLIHDDDDDTIAIMQLVVLLQGTINDDDDDHVDNGFNINDTDGRISKTNNNYKIIDEGTDTTIDSVLSPLVLLLQSGSVVLYQDENDDGDTTITIQLVLYRDKNVLPLDYQYRYSTTTTDGELISMILFRLVYRLDWILLCRLAYRIDIMYRVDKILPSIVLLLRSQSVHKGDDTIFITPLVAPYQDVHEDDDNTIMHDNTFASMQLVQYQDKYILPSLVYCSSTAIDGEFDDDDNNDDDDDCYDNNINILHEDDLISGATTVQRRRTLSSTVPSLVLAMVFRLAYRVNRMYRVDTILSSIVLLLQSRSSLNMIPPATQNEEHNAEEYYCYADIIIKNNVNTSFINNTGIIAIDASLRVGHSNGNETTTLISSIQDGIDGKEKRLEEKYQSRALHSQGQYKDEVYNAEEGMFQEPILRLEYYPVMILMCSFSRTSIGDGDESTTLISNIQNEECYKKIEEKGERPKEPVPIFLMIRLCLCFLLIVTMRLLVQSMGSVKIHKDRVNQVSQTRARLEARLEVNREPLESCIQSDVFVCSSLLKLVCSSLLKGNTTVKNCLMRRCTYGTLIL